MQSFNYSQQHTKSPFVSPLEVLPLLRQEHAAFKMKILTDYTNFVVFAFEKWKHPYEAPAIIIVCSVYNAISFILVFFEQESM